MLDSILKLFGTKAERDLKVLTPYVKMVNVEYQKLQTVSDDQLRSQTAELKNEISNYLKDIDTEVESLKKKAEDPELDVAIKEDLFARVDKLEEERNKK